MKRALWLLLLTVPALGEDLIFKDAAGRVLTTKDLEHVTGKVSWEILGTESVPPEAKHLHDDARAAGEKGDYPRAHQLLERAHQLAPRWPYPLYDDAFTHLLEDHADRAEQLYDQVEKLAPRGFFSSKREHDCLRRQKQGKLPAGFCKAFALLEWMAPAEKRNLLSGITDKFPAYAPAWLQLAKLTDSSKQKLAFLERGLACSGDADTRGALLVDKALLLRDRGDRQGAVRILGALALDPQSTLGNAAMAKWILAQTLTADVH